MPDSEIIQSKAFVNTIKLTCMHAHTHTHVHTYAHSCTYI